MTATAYERHLERAHALMTRRMRSCAAGLPAAIARAPATHAAQRALRAEVATTLARHHAACAAAFAEALQQSFAEFTRPPAPATPGLWLNLGDLEIMDDSRIQDEIEVAQVVHILAESCGVELRRLLKFEEALRRSEGARVSASPIGPPGLARALWASTEGLNQGVAARVETVRSAARWFAPRLSEIYAAVRQAGFADASHGEAADRATAAEETEAVSPPTGFDVTRPGALYELLDLDDQRPVFAASEAPPLQAIPDTQPLPLEGQDARIPDLIHSHREELMALRDAAGARLAVALIGHLFTQIVADPALSPEARAAIGRLQPGVVRLATQDASLLQSHRHPVWTLINRIATHMSAAKGPPAPEFLQWLAATVAQVEAEPSGAVFEAAGERLTQWQRKQAQRRLTDVEGALELLRRNASQEELVARARAKLQRQLDSAQPPSAVKRFILTLWSLVVAQEAAARGPEASGTPRTSPAMDAAVDLIWSTDAARSRADAPTLVGLIPELVERLTAGMATVQLSEAIRKAWLEQLAAIHLHALRRPAGTAPTSGPVTVDLELDDELPPAAPAPRVVDPTDPLGALQVGDTVAMQLHGDWMDVQLLWLSDNGEFLLFSGANGGSRSFTRKALRKLLEQGLLRTTEARSALERASDEIIRRRH
ncbi:MAG: DUF1631 family protein [Betaproteobacteria bacterium]